MNNSNSNDLTILDLPDEILLIILKKLNVVDVLYSLVDVNPRLDRLALDSINIRDLDMTICDHTLIDTRVLSRICEKILPRIHHEVHKLPVESYSMKDNLVAANYPQLYSLSLENFQEETLQQYLAEKTSQIEIFLIHRQFLIYMAQLKKFTFNINTEAYRFQSPLELPTNEIIQRSFIGRNYKQVASYVHNEAMETSPKCHIYSLPYDFEYFTNLDNSFQGDMFHKVRYLTMCDKHPFEDRLFQLISQDFSFLECLDISNTHPQKDKQRSSTSLTFPYLKCLDLKCTHDDYAELFPLKKSTHLPCLLNPCMEYKSLTTITNNFTNDATHLNFGTLKSLDISQPFVRPESFHQYFPLL